MKKLKYVPPHRLYMKINCSYEKDEICFPALIIFDNHQFLWKSWYMFPALIIYDKHQFLWTSWYMSPGMIICNSHMSLWISYFEKMSVCPLYCVAYWTRQSSWISIWKKWNKFLKLSWSLPCNPSSSILVDERFSLVSESNWNRFLSQSMGSNINRCVII